MSERGPLLSGRLRAAGHDENAGAPIVEFDEGAKFAYAPVTPEKWRRLITSPPPGNHFREHSEEERTPRRIARNAFSSAKKNPLDDLFS